jgi:predicted AAA+ superfamily ATPase
MMDSDLLKQVIIEQSQRTTPPDYVPRLIYNQVQEYQKNKEIIIISGIRRCGKSTLLQKIRNGAKEKDYYLNFEDDRLVNFTVADFQKLLEVFGELFGKQTTFYFDEIQNIPEWERFVRRLHEQGSKIYITGSNATMLSKELGTKLTGRFIPLTMYPYSFYEHVNAAVPELIGKAIYTTDEIGIILSLFATYCRVGGIPEFVKFEQPAYLHSLYEGIIYRDIITRYKLPQERPIRELTFYLASNAAKEVTFNALRKTINLSSATTTAEYCSYLENCFLSFLINRYSHSLSKQIYYGKKQYFIDHALANTIGFRISDDKGRLLENIVFIELKRRGADIYFHKDKKECDFIIRAKNNVATAIQVCTSLTSDDVKKREYAGLLEAMQAYNLHEGLILTTNEEAKDEITLGHQKYKITILPTWKWLLRIDAAT